MRLYNAHSCTPMVSASRKSPPKTFLPPRQSDGYEAWKLRSRRPVETQELRKIPEYFDANKELWPIQQTNSSNTASISDESPAETGTPFLLRGMSRSQRENRIRVEELMVALPALRDLDNTAMLAGSKTLEGESDDSSLTTLSTMTTRASFIDDSPVDMVLSLDHVPSTFVEKGKTGSPFSGADYEWPTKKNIPKVKNRVELPWPSEHIHDDGFRSPTVSLTKSYACTEESSPAKSYKVIRARLHQVQCKESPLKRTPSKQNVVSTPPQHYTPDVDKENSQTLLLFSQKLSPSDFVKVRSPPKETTPESFAKTYFFGCLSEESVLKVGDDIFRIQSNTSPSNITLSASNIYPQRQECETHTFLDKTKKVLFHFSDEKMNKNSVNSPQEQDIKHANKCPPKEDQQLDKYYRMLKMGLPMGAVQNAMRRDGLDPIILEGDGCSALSSNPRATVPEMKKQRNKIRHFRIHWETHNEVRSDTIWAMINRDPDVTAIHVDEEEVKDLFCCGAQPQPKAFVPAKYGEHSRGHGAVKVIDAKRANNGGITLARIKLTYNEIARAVDNFDQDAMTAEQIRGLMNFIPNTEEKEALRAYLADPNHSRTMLCECEKFMVAMMGIQHAKRKLSALLFMQSFSSCLEDLRRDARVVQKACDEIMDSARFRKILGVILTLGNQLNTAGSNGKQAAAAITLESLLKLDQAKAFDRQTTFLDFVVATIRRNKASLIHFKDDMPFVFKVEKMQWSLVLSEMLRMEEGLDEVRKIALHFCRVQAGLPVGDTVTVDSSVLPIAREVELLQTTSVGRFTLDACLRMAVLVNDIEKAKDQSKALFQYFGEKTKADGQPDEIFHTIRTFGHNFDRALDDIIAREKAKVQEMRGFPLIRCDKKSFDGVDLAPHRLKHDKSDESQSKKPKGKFRWGRRKF